MTTEQFKQKQAEMSNEELIKLASGQVSDLAKTGGKSHRMCIPPMITDTDMLLSEVIERFERSIANENTLKDFVNSIALYKENDDKRELTAIKLSDFEKLKELYNMIKF